jgi:hypothetical protein
MLARPRRDRGRRNRHAATPREQQRLIANQRRRRAGGHRVHALAAATATIAATDDPGSPTRFAQALDQPQHQRRLAATPDGQVADDDHRRWQPLCAQYPAAEQPAAQPGEPGEQPGQRQ